MACTPPAPTEWAFSRNSMAVRGGRSTAKESGVNPRVLRGGDGGIGRHGRGGEKPATRVID